jgi:hypothetical protein
MSVHATGSPVSLSLSDADSLPDCDSPPSAVGGRSLVQPNVETSANVEAQS